MDSIEPLVRKNTYEKQVQSSLDESELPLDMDWVMDQLVDDSDSIVCCSNLRRAISTAVIGLWQRFGVNNESIHILPALQELGMNVDTHTPVLSTDLPEPSDFELKSNKLNVNKLIDFYQNRLTVEKSFVAKRHLRESAQDQNQRVYLFANWAFRPEAEKNVIIAVGHSHWFRKFFREFVKGNHVSKTQKVQNCGAIAFRMTCEVREDGTRSYEIKPGAITTIYKGFQ